MKMPDLGKMYGPLPLGVWVAVIGVGVGIVVWQRKATNEPAEMVEGFVYRDTSTDPGVGMGGSGMWTNLTPPSTDSGTISAAPVDNDSWASIAINRAIADGFDPAIADYAIRRYISGYENDTQGWAIVRHILRAVGAPPIPLGAPTNAPTPLPKPSTPTPTPAPKPAPKPIIKLPVEPPKPAPAPNFGDPKVVESMLRDLTDNMGLATPAKGVSYVRHVVTKGETMASIANRYKIRWQTLYDANKAGVRRADGSLGNIVSTANLVIGSTLIIPR